MLSKDLKVNWWVVQSGQGGCLRKFDDLHM